MTISKSIKPYIIGLFLLFLLALGFLYGVFNLRKVFKNSPELLQQYLKKQEIEMVFKLKEATPTDASIQLENIKISGKRSPSLISINKLSVDFDFGFSPLLKIILQARGVVGNKNSAYKNEPIENAAVPKSNSLWLKLVSFILLKSTLTLEIADIDLPEQGIENFFVSLFLDQIQVRGGSLSHLRISHDFTLNNLVTMPFFPGLTTRGATLFENDVFTFQNHRVEVGPFVTKMNGQYSLTDQKWNVDYQIPKTNIKSKDENISEKNASLINSITGDVELSVSASGIAADYKSLTAEGKLLASRLNMGVNAVNIKGIILSDISLLFKKDSTLSYQADINTDLSKTDSTYEDLFRKTNQDPLLFKAHFTGDENKILISNAELVFNNLKALFSGQIPLNQNEKSLIKFHVPPVNVLGWERFFPKYSTLKSRGSLELNGAFSGELKNWQLADLNLTLNAQDLRFPILKNWFSEKNLLIEGPCELNSTTLLSIAGGSIKNVTTNSQLNLTDTTITYANQFTKAANTSLNVTLLLKSDKNRVSIQKGMAKLKNNILNITGGINNLSNPNISLKFETNDMSLNSLTEFFPGLTSTSTDEARGLVSLKGAVNGKVLSPTEKPQFTADISVKNGAVNYKHSENTAPILLKEINSAIHIQNDSIDIRKLAFSSVASKGTLGLSLTSFDKPTINFNAEFSSFDLKDFYSPKKEVPLEKKRTTESADDFMKNPLLKQLTLNGNIKIKNALAGTLKINELYGKVAYANLKLDLSPLSIKAKEGDLTANISWDGNKTKPVTKQELNFNSINTNDLISLYSDQYTDLVTGTVDGKVNLEFSGLTIKEMKKSAIGSGNFKLKNATLKSIKLTKGPLEAMKKLPLLGNYIHQTDWDEKLNEMSGGFTLKNEKIVLSNIIMRSPYFEVLSHATSIDFNKNIDGKLDFFPKESILSGPGIEVIKDESGRSNIPLTVTGHLQKPVLSFDNAVLEVRVKKYFSHRAQEEKDRALSTIKNKAKQTLDSAVKGGLQNIFK